MIRLCDPPENDNDIPTSIKLHSHNVSVPRFFVPRFFVCSLAASSTTAHSSASSARSTRPSSLAARLWLRKFVRLPLTANFYAPAGATYLILVTKARSRSEQSLIMWSTDAWVVISTCCFFRLSSSIALSCVHQRECNVR